jgi:hypothetical protein
MRGPLRAAFHPLGYRVTFEIYHMANISGLFQPSPFDVSDLKILHPGFIVSALGGHGNV